MDIQIRNLHNAMLEQTQQLVESLPQPGAAQQPAAQSIFLRCHGSLPERFEQPRINSDFHNAVNIVYGGLASRISCRLLHDGFCSEFAK